MDVRLAEKISASGASILATDKPSRMNVPVVSAKRNRADPAPPASRKKLLEPPKELVQSSIDGFDLQIGNAVEELRLLALLALPLPPEAQYLTPDLLDKRAEMLGDLPMEYPTAAAISGARGTVVLRVLIDETGEVGGVQLVSTTSEDAYAELARQAFLSARFAPALKDGRPVKSQKTVELTFSPE